MNLKVAAVIVAAPLTVGLLLGCKPVPHHHESAKSYPVTESANTSPSLGKDHAKFPAPNPTGVGSVPGVKSAGLEQRIPVPQLAQPAPSGDIGLALAVVAVAPAEAGSTSVSSIAAASGASPPLAPQLAQTGTEDLPQLGLVGGALLLIGVACTTAARRLRRQI